ncbi:MAG: sugar transferase [Chloroflexi bacterium]|nr:sugar transferase [Chloroflexota bacterium]
MILKRILDITASLMGLVVLAPFFIIFAIAIRFGSPGPIFHKAKRVGKDGQEFRLYKFRTMVNNADKQGPGITASGDSRITPMGRILRRTKLDELPQLINVLRGEMSLVGPRPEDPRYVALYSENQRVVLSVHPGITSLASVEYRNEEKILQGNGWEKLYVEKVMPDKLTLDLSYVENQSLWLDIKIIVKTLLSLFK